MNRKFLASLVKCLIRINCTTYFLINKELCITTTLLLAWIQSTINTNTNKKYTHAPTTNTKPPPKDNHPPHTIQGPHTTKQPYTKNPRKHKHTYNTTQHINPCRYNKLTPINTPYYTLTTLTIIFLITIQTHHTILPPKSVHTPTYQTCPTQQPNHKSPITSPYHTYPENEYHINTHNPSPITTITQLTTSIPPINTTSHIGYIKYITHIHLKTPKNKNIHYYIWNNSIIILLGGDIHTNPGPSPHILENLPIEYTQRQKQYFIHNTTTLKSQYAHLEELFGLYLHKTTSQTQSHDLTHIRKHSSLLSAYPINHQIYAFIIAYSPIPNICNQLMSNNLDPRCLTILRRLHNQPPNTYPTKQHITPTSITQITTLAQVYSYINDNIAKGHLINMQNLSNKFPHIPHKILEELIKCTQPIRGYHPNTQYDNPDDIPPVDTHAQNHQTTTLTIITWNTGCISSSLPGIQELTHTLHKNPHIILI